MRNDPHSRILPAPINFPPSPSFSPSNRRKKTEPLKFHSHLFPHATHSHPFFGAKGGFLQLLTSLWKMYESSFKFEPLVGCTNIFLWNATHTF